MSEYMNQLPYGMSENMMEIVKVNALAKKNGAAYGSYTGQHDVSQFAVKKESKKRYIHICERCGKEIPSLTACKRKYCDECACIVDKKRKAAAARARARGEFVYQGVVVKCSECGKEIIRHCKRTDVKCDECKKKKRSEISRSWYAREKERKAKKGKENKNV